MIHDEAATCELLRILLQQEGYFVRALPRAEKGKRAFRSWRPDLVIVNGFLPDGDGLDLLGEFKALKPVVPVIYQSSALTTEKIEAALERGALVALEDFDPDILLPVIAEALRRPSEL